MNVLAVGCHPDDLEICCFGTLRKYVEKGANVYACHIASGNLGHATIQPDELAIIRKIEAEKAGELIGLKQVYSLEVNDMEVNAHDQNILNELAEIIRFVKPDVLITHNTDDYMRDHREASIIATEAAFISGLAHRSDKLPAYKSLIPTFFIDTLAGVNFNPTHYVDITDQIEMKLKAFSLHETQVKSSLENDNLDFLEMVRTCSRYRGFQCGVAYAEGFKAHNVYQRHSTQHLLP